jgi:hypothetical protein
MRHLDFIAIATSSAAILRAIIHGHVERAVATRSALHGRFSCRMVTGTTGFIRLCARSLPHCRLEIVIAMQFLLKLRVRNPISALPSKDIDWCWRRFSSEDQRPSLKCAPGIAEVSSESDQVTSETR